MLRKQRSLQRQLAGMRGTERSASEEEKRVRAELERTQKDLDYIDFYPKGTKYVALFPSHHPQPAPPRPRNAGSSDEDEEGEQVIGGEEERREKEEAKQRKRRQQREEEEAKDRSAASHDHQVVDTASTAPEADEEKAKAAEAAEAERRERMRQVVQRAKDKATAGDTKAAMAAHTTSATKEKRRREFRDPFFLQEDDEEAAADSTGDAAADANVASAVPHTSTARLNSRHLAADRARVDRPRHNRDDGRSSREARPPRGEGDHRRAAPISTPAQSAGAPRPSVPYNARKHLPISQAPRNVHKIVDDESAHPLLTPAPRPPPSHPTGPASAPPNERPAKRKRRSQETRQREEEQGEEGKERKEPLPSYNAEEGVGSDTAAAGPAAKKKRRRKKKAASAEVDSDEAERDGVRAEEEQQRVQLRQSVHSILQLDGDHDDDD